jgi:hypothetical protein
MIGPVGPRGKIIQDLEAFEEEEKREIGGEEDTEAVQVRSNRMMEGSVQQICTWDLHCPQRRLIY